MARRLSFAEGIREALMQEMHRDASVCVIGQEVGAPGGVHGATRGLQAIFGEMRVRDMPISEQAIAGAAAGAAMVGMRPVAEIMHASLLGVCWDMVVNQIASATYLSGGQLSMPLVIRTVNGGGSRLGPQLSHPVEGWLMGIPGLKVVMPASPLEAAGLLAGAIRDPDPVVFLEPRSLYGMVESIEDRPREHCLPLGRSRVVLEGDDIVVLTIGPGVRRAVAAAERAARCGISVAVTDLRTLVPFDRDGVCAAAARGRPVVIVEDDAGTGGWGADVACFLTAECGAHQPVRRIAARDVPVAAAPALEDSILPSVDRVVGVILEVARLPGAARVNGRLE